MFNKLLPFTLIASFALPFIAKADESPVTAEQPKPAAQGLKKEQIHFMKLVEKSVKIENQLSEESTPEIKAFLNAVKEELQKIGITVKNPCLLLILHSRKLDIAIMKELEEKYITQDMQALLEKYSFGKPDLVENMAILMLANTSSKANIQ